MSSATSTVAAATRAPRATTAADSARVRWGRRFQHGGWFVAPFFVLYGFGAAPLVVRGLYLSLHRRQHLRDHTNFVGLDNYREAFKDDLVWNSLLAQRPSCTSFRASSSWPC